MNTRYLKSFKKCSGAFGSPNAPILKSNSIGLNSQPVLTDSQLFSFPFFNRSFDKKRLKLLFSWYYANKGEVAAFSLVETLQKSGFQYAMKAGISLGVDDLKVPPSKGESLTEAVESLNMTKASVYSGNVTPLEEFQQFVDTWHRTSENLKTRVVQNFTRKTKKKEKQKNNNFSKKLSLNQEVSEPKTRSYGNTLNPVYMMAFSGARGNLSQVRQLVGMRGLMADPQGQLVEFPIQSNFREGLTVTEYMISCYGARKGLVDTALRTAAAGYLTRRLVDVSHHQIVRSVTCGTKGGIWLSTSKGDTNESQNLPSAWKRKKNEGITNEKKRGSLVNPIELKDRPSNFDLKKENKINPRLTSGVARGVGRVLARDIPGVAFRNQEIDISLGSSPFLQEVYETVGIYVRSPLTCKSETGICQLCYGWSVSANQLIGLGEAVGIIAAQSIGEPGTQLTMRTFHTGGVFSGDIMEECRAKHEGTVYFQNASLGLLVRTAGGAIAFCIKTPQIFKVKGTEDVTTYSVAANTLLFVRQGEKVQTDSLLAQIPNLPDIEESTGESTKTVMSNLSGEVRQIPTVNLELESIRILAGQQQMPMFLESSQLGISVPLSSTSFPDTLKNSPSKLPKQTIGFGSIEKSPRADSMKHKKLFMPTTRGRVNIVPGSHRLNNSTKTIINQNQEFEDRFLKIKQTENIRGQITPLVSATLEQNPVFLSKLRYFTFSKMQQNANVKTSWQKDNPPKFFKNKAWSLKPKPIKFLDNYKGPFIKNLPNPKIYSDIYNEGEIVKNRTPLVFLQKNVTKKYLVFTDKNPQKSETPKLTAVFLDNKLGSKKGKAVSLAPPFAHSIIESFSDISKKTLSNNHEFQKNLTVLQKSNKGLFSCTRWWPVQSTIRPREANVLVTARMSKLNVDLWGFQKNSFFRNFNSLELRNYAYLFWKLSSLIYLKEITKNKKTLLSKLEVSINAKWWGLDLCSTTQESSFYLSNKLNKKEKKRFPLSSKEDVRDLYLKGSSKIQEFPNLTLKMLSRFTKKNQINRLERTQEASCSFKGMESGLQNSGEIFPLQGNITIKDFQKNYVEHKQSGQKQQLSQKMICAILMHYDRVSYKNFKTVSVSENFKEEKKEQVNFHRNFSHKIASFINIGDEIFKDRGSAYCGQIIEKSGSQLTLRFTQNILYSNCSHRPAKISPYVTHNNWIGKGAPLVTLPYITSMTGDIVAGIPKIEQLFEARGEALEETIDKIWCSYKSIVPKAKAVRECFKEIGLFVVQAIQKVYSSQGVHIADKHLEVIIRQMTRRALIVDPGDTEFLADEFVDLQTIECVNWTTYGENASYRPRLIGITKASLTSNSFLSSASFQQTARVLERETLLEKTDRLLGLKERVMMGALINAGTGGFKTGVRLPGVTEKKQFKT